MQLTNDCSFAVNFLFEDKAFLVLLQRNPLAAEVSFVKCWRVSCFWSFLVPKSKPTWGICDSDSWLFFFYFCFMGTSSRVHRYSTACCRNAWDSLLSAAQPSIWVATAVGFRILLSRLSDSRSCLSVLGKRMIISQLCRVKSHVYKQNCFTEYDPMAGFGSPPAPPSPLPLSTEKKVWGFIYCKIYSVGAAPCVISSYRLFFRTAQTSDNYSFGTMMSYNLIP